MAGVPIKSDGVNLLLEAGTKIGGIDAGIINIKGSIDASNDLLSKTGVSKGDAYIVSDIGEVWVSTTTMSQGCSKYNKKTSILNFVSFRSNTHKHRAGMSKKSQICLPN